MWPDLAGHSGHLGLHLYAEGLWSIKEEDDQMQGLRKRASNWGLLASSAPHEGRQCAVMWPDLAGRSGHLGLHFYAEGLCSIKKEDDQMHGLRKRASNWGLLASSAPQEG